MTKQDLGNEQTTIVADGAELVVERVFDAPRDLVWAALTSPQHIAKWWGRMGTTTKVVELDVRPGGKWRFIAETAEGGGAPFAGEFLEVTAPERFVRTIVFDVAPFNQMPKAVDTVTLEEVDGKTKVYNHTQFPSADVLNGAIADGMQKGAIEQFDRLADLLVELA